MRSSFRIFEGKSGEMIGRVMRTGEEEISKLSFSHNEAVWFRDKIPEDGSKYRAELWVPEEGGEFEAVILDAFNVQGVSFAYDGEFLTTFDLSKYPDLINYCPVYLFDKDGVLADVVGKYSLISHSVTFRGNRSAYFPCLVYITTGGKGFLSVPIIGDQSYAQQLTGSREVTVRYFEEGEDV